VAARIKEIYMATENSRNSTRGQPLMALGTTTLHTAWLQFIRYCAELGHGEIEKLKIQDGLPMVAETTVKKVKFAP
jgi:hypothetical protein